MTARSNSAQLLWLDMEMSGLDVEKEVPIEVAAIVTDWQLGPLGEPYHAIIKQPQKYLDAMDDWNRKHHGESGLLAAIPNGRDPSEVDSELAALVRRHFGTERAILAGNSISQDRLFIRPYMPKLDATLHYRMLDVTAWKVMFNGAYNLRFKKNDVHRALDDILESMNELKYYMSFIKPGVPNA
ncbi:MAG TPA: oligoribonuclease [Bdellovibrionales bacterium]|nr:oligoribonuclease [Bdellovibrionales bacterium]